MRVRRNLFAFLLGFVLAIYGGWVSAAESCSTFRYANCTQGSCTMTASDFVGSAPKQQWADAHKAKFTACIAGGGGGCYSDWEVTRNLVGSPGAGGGWRIESQCTTGGTSPGCGKAVQVRSGTVQNLGAAACPPDPCDAYAGKKVTYAQNFPGGLPEMGGNFNIPVAGGCGAERSAASSCTPGAGGAFFCMVTYTYTGDPPEASPSTPGGGQAQCAMVQGKQNCAVTTNDDTGQTCGTFNGERICFPADPTVEGSGGQPSSESCWSTSGGGMLCADDAVVEDGEGDPVSPTQVLVTGSGTSNYYDSTTIATSSVTTIITGAGPMGSESPGADSDCEGLDCLEGGDMTGAGEAGEVAAGAMGRIGEAPIVAAVSGLSGALTGGSCPSWATTIEAGAFGTYELDFSFICSMWEDIAPVIAAVMLAGWVLVALRILMSA